MIPEDNPKIKPRQNALRQNATGRHRGAYVIIREPTKESTTERRYQDQEIARIFATASEAPAVLKPRERTGGLTLSELQQIGREVGVPADAIAKAAAELKDASAASWRQPAAVLRRYFGLPVAVGRTVELRSGVSTTEWEQILTDLRTTFDARGRVDAEGGLRQWKTLGVEAVLEATDSGSRFHLRAFKRGAVAWLWSALISLAGAQITFVVPLAELAMNYKPWLLASIFLTVSAIALAAAAALHLPSWSRIKRQQIDGVIARLQAATEPKSP